MKITLTVTRNRALALLAALLGAVALSVAACNNNGGGNTTEHAQQLQDTTTLENNQPLPHFNFSQERQNMKDIENAEANNVQTTTFFMNMGVPDPIGSCPSIGFGIPDSASLSNPQQVVGNGNGGTEVVGQMDPTGIYAPVSSQGTFVICLTGSGQPYIDRIESQTDTYGGPAEWNYSKHMAVMSGAPTAAASVSPPSSARKK